MRSKILFEKQMCSKALSWTEDLRSCSQFLADDENLLICRIVAMRVSCSHFFILRFEQSTVAARTCQSLYIIEVLQLRSEVGFG